MADDSDSRYLWRGGPGNGLTYTEAHAAALGLTGLLAGIGLRLGLRSQVTAWTVTTFAVAFGLKQWSEKPPTAVRTLRRESWYYVVSYIITAVLSWSTYPLLP